MSCEETDYGELIDTTKAGIPAELLRLAFEAGRGQAELDRTSEGERVQERIKRLAQRDNARNFWMHSDEADGPEPQSDEYYDDFTQDGLTHDLSGLNQDRYR